MFVSTIRQGDPSDILEAGSVRWRRELDAAAWFGLCRLSSRRGIAARWRILLSMYGRHVLP
jgi:hypothetical protein